MEKFAGTDDLSNAVGFLIAEASRHVRRSLYSRIAAYGVRGGSWYPLRVLWQRDGLTQREIATRLGITEPSTHEMLRAMEADGLVERRRNDEDRRKMRIYLTRRAEKLREPLLAIADEVNGVALAGLKKTEQRQLKLALQHVIQQLSDDSLDTSIGSGGQPLNFHEESVKLSVGGRRRA